MQRSTVAILHLGNKWEWLNSSDPALLDSGLRSSAMIVNFSVSSHFPVLVGLRRSCVPVAVSAPLHPAPSTSPFEPTRTYPVSFPHETYPSSKQSDAFCG